MSCKKSLLLAGLILLALPWANVQAGPYVGVYIGGPCCRPYWGGYYRPYWPYYVAPPIVIGATVAPAPVVVQQAPAPIYVQPSLSPAQPTPSQAPSLETVPPPQPIPVSPVPADLSVPRPAAFDSRANDIDQGLRNLSNSDARVRADAAIQLGRLKAQRAADSLERVLASDPSPDVRDAAARGLGLIGLAGSLPALQRAAQADGDRGVRSSAQFAVEVIRSR